MRRHGDWPLYLPADERDESAWLYEQMAAPIVAGGCECEALCVCDSEADHDES